MVDINVILDDRFEEPLVNIYTKIQTEQVDNIICAIEDAVRNKYPPIPVMVDGKLQFISQRMVYRIRTDGRKVSMDTEKGTFAVKGTIARFEEELDAERFFRISQSEIINLYKVSFFDFSANGTIGVEFENGERSWVARRCVKPLRKKLRNEM